MPDYSLIPSLTVTQDQRGNSFNAGVGDANTSELGAFFEGFTRTAESTTRLRTAQLAQAAEYDPAKLAAEQAIREANAAKIAEEVLGLQIENEFGRARQQANLDQVASQIERNTVLNRGTEATTRKTGIETDILEEFGRQDAASVIQQRRASAAASFAAAEQARTNTALDLQFGEEERRLGIDRKRTEIAKDLTSILKDVRGGDELKEQLANLKTRAEIIKSLSPDTKAEQRETENYTKGLETRRSALERQKASLEKEAFGVPKEGSPFYEPYQNVKKQLEEIEAIAAPIGSPERTSYGIPSPSQLAAQEAEEKSPLLAIKADMMNRLQAIQSKAEAVQVGQEAEQVRAIEEQISTVLNQINTSRYNSVAIEKTSKVIKGSLSTDGAGNQDITPALTELAVIDDIWEKDPANRELATKRMAEAFKDLGGTKQIIEKIEADPTIPADQKQALKKSVYKAAVHTGNPKNLGPIQESMAKLGLGEEEIIDPEKSLQDIQKLLSNNATEVQSNALKALQFHPSNYFALARNASKNNTQAFQALSDVMPVKGDSGETGASNAQTLPITVFQGADGTRLEGSAPQDAASFAFFDILQTIAKKSAGDLAVARNTQTRQQNLEGAVQKRDTYETKIADAQGNPPPDAKPQPKNFQRMFETRVNQAVEKTKAQWQAKNPGKKLPPEMEREWRRLATIQATKQYGQQQ